MIRLLARLLPVVAAVAAAAALLAAPAAAEPLEDHVVRTRSPADVRALVRALGVRPTAEFGSAVAGFAAPLTRRQVERLTARPEVLDVERDGRTTPLDGRRTTTAPLNWGLDRIDQRALPLSGTYTTRATGAGVTIFVLDTGVDVAHPQFGGRAVTLANTADDVDGDCDGHGTVVAGIAAGAESGVARGARVASVKVLDCTGAGTLSSLLAGIDAVAGAATGPGVVVTSWSHGPSDVLAAAVAGLVERGLLVAASAGNTGGDDCTAVPRAVDGVLVVAGTTIDDRRDPASSTGDCVDLYAPGTAIVSSVPGGGTAAYSGTSMAAPHAAGVAALHLEASGAAPAAVVERRLVDGATPGVVAGGDAGGTANLLLHTAGL